MEDDVELAGSGKLKPTQWLTLILLFASMIALTVRCEINKKAEPTNENEDKTELVEEKSTKQILRNYYKNPVTIFVRKNSSGENPIDSFVVVREKRSPDNNIDTLQFIEDGVVLPIVKKVSGYY